MDHLVGGIGSGHRGQADFLNIRPDNTQPVNKARSCSDLKLNRQGHIRLRLLVHQYCLPSNVLPECYSDYSDCSRLSPA